MKQHRTSNAGKVAAIAAAAVFVVGVVVLRIGALLPLVLASGTFAAVWLALLPSLPRARAAKAAKAPPLPDGVSRTDFDDACTMLDRGSYRLRELADRSSGEDRKLFLRLSDLVARIALHHHANPAHLRLTRRFVRHGLGQMVEAAAGYVDLRRRSGPEQAERLRAVRTELEDLVDALAGLERACIEDDLTALEVHVEVLNQQFGGRHG